MQAIHPDELKLAVRNMLDTNMNLKPRERVLVVSDAPRPEDWLAASYARLEELVRHALLARQMADQARIAFPECPVDFLSFPTTGQHGAEPPDWVAEKMRGYDVVLIPTTYSLSHTNARTAACEHGARVASMPGIEADMFSSGRPMQADYTAVSRECEQWAARLTAGSQVRVVTALGTDITFSIAGRTGRVDNGLFHARGDWGNLPAGEAYIAPLEGTANGQLVAPAGWYPNLTENLVLTFKAGEVVSAIGGGLAGEELRAAFCVGEDRYRHRRNCAELGIGTNPFASRADNVLEAEKIRGTIHIAVGDSAHMGGVNESDLHEDFIIPQPALYIDGLLVPVGQ